MQRSVLARIKAHAGFEIRSRGEKDARHLGRRWIVAVLAEGVDGGRLGADELVARVSEEEEVAEAPVLRRQPIHRKTASLKEPHVRDRGKPSDGYRVEIDLGAGGILPERERRVLVVDQGAARGQT